MFDGKACVRPGMKDTGLRKKVISQLFDPAPGHPILLAPRALQRSADNGKDALAESCRLFYLPSADFGRRGRREHEHHRIGLANQVAEASLPVLATGDALAVDDALKAANIG
jgi:hypothetical protein